jgi:hypothetical protein
MTSEGRQQPVQGIGLYHTEAARAKVERALWMLDLLTAAAQWRGLMAAQQAREQQRRGERGGDDIGGGDSAV